MELVICDNTKEIPSVKLRCYSLDEKYTQKNAEDAYREYYKAEPKKAYLWSNYLYIELPKI